ncbi:MAG: class I lanthipeptide [Spirosomataceae bacterium]
MKKQLKKLAFSTEKIVSLNKTDLQAVNGGTWGPSNGGQSHNCLAITGHRSCIC